MKRLLIISYWIIAILLMAVVLSSLDYSFLEALFIGSLFLPGALAARYFFPKVNYKNRWSGIGETIFIVLGILFGEILLFMIAHFCILSFRGNLPGAMINIPDLPSILSNPVFIAIILTSLAAGSHFFEAWLDKKLPSLPGSISFTSERKAVTLPIEGGRRFKNYTPISQWEATLKPYFIRIHRSYLVNKSAVTRIDVDLLYIDDIQLPISRKYKEVVSDIFQ